jgi:hypothetical protein
MMNFSYLRRRVSISHKHGILQVRIASSSDRGPIAATAIPMAIIGLMQVALIKTMWHQRAYLYVAILLIFGLWFWLVRTAIREKLGVDEISIQNGTLHWTSKALWLRQEADIPLHEISDVRAVTPWHARWNRVELIVKGGTYQMGTGILRDEAEQLAHELKKVIHTVAIQR